ncbi:Hypothetical protein, conserved [Brucella abortus str. 2308 A]|uniref:Uncharacterized protein n=1 Tax=Brucella ceti str. Cudo TaxID=595497 RepID=C0G329_9HYPH|nr:hypothetical protein BMNI_I1982 [Brucella melitensis NI]AEW14193.1 hypothetical protein BCA52141_I1875 [Brucella canis HSK A52141]AEW16777.1 hypothetical protein BAA13334_I00661 [Brucella abortus A13334]AIB18583.1 Hypothetical protein BSSP3_I1884 [Brucella suis bv. 2]EEH15161.1 Hypothetical protein, conserved [Brucella ceti str. Cudo]EEP62714.1 Hypothetical protein, conserved [Brucella abortus str. 2308 A]EPZ76053.1 hypothetical protein M798_08355 [Brucella melitensis ADMAS-G1]ERM05278.1 
MANCKWPTAAKAFGKADKPFLIPVFAAFMLRQVVPPDCKML